MLIKILSLFEKRQKHEDNRHDKGLATEQEDDRATVKGNQILWRVNPFWDEVQMKTTRKRIGLKDDAKVITNLKTGEREGVAELTKVYEVDAEQFVKVFIRHLTAFFDTSKNAQKLFEFALHEVSKTIGKDRVYLHPKDADRYHKATRGKGFSQASFYRAMDELTQTKILARCDTQWMFFINPSVFFNGDRARFVTEMRKAPELFMADDEEQVVAYDAQDIFDGRISTDEELE